MSHLFTHCWYVIWWLFFLAFSNDEIKLIGPLTKVVSIFYFVCCVVNIVFADKGKGTLIFSPYMAFGLDLLYYKKLTFTTKLEKYVKCNNHGHSHFEILLSSGPCWCHITLQLVRSTYNGDIWIYNVQDSFRMENHPSE